VAAQDKAISTNYSKKKMLKEEIESKRRLSKQHEETIEHLTLGCPILAKNVYLMRHVKICTHLHYSMCKALGIETTDKWYTHIPKPVCEDGDVTMLWIQAVHTDRKVTANRSHIRIKNRKGKTCTPIDVTIPADRNVVQKEAKKKLKYNSRDTTNVEPEICDSTSNNWSHWNSNKKLKKNLGTVPRRHSIDSLQKTAILGTSHIIRKVLQCES